MTMRGGNSLLIRASPGMSFTRAGAPNVRPPSRLTAANTSAESFVDADHATATMSPAAAIEALAFVRPWMARCAVVSGVASPRVHAASAINQVQIPRFTRDDTTRDDITRDDPTRDDNFIGGISRS